jgi:hypothetical protein
VLSTDRLLQHPAPESVLDFSHGEIFRMCAKPLSDPHVLQTGAPTDAFARVDGCKTGNNCMSVSEVDMACADGCFAGRTLLKPDFNLSQPSLISSNVPGTGVAFCVRSID